MSRRDIWAYEPSICDGDFCPMNCDICPKRHLVEDKRAEEEDEDASV